MGLSPTKNKTTQLVTWDLLMTHDWISHARAETLSRKELDLKLLCINARNR